MIQNQQWHDAQVTCDATPMCNAVDDFNHYIFALHHPTWNMILPYLIGIIILATMFVVVGLEKWCKRD